MKDISNEFKSQVLSDPLNTQIILSYDERYFHIAKVLDQVVKDEDGNKITKRVFKEEKKVSCISFSEDEIDYEIDLHGYVMLHGLGINSDIIIDEDYYLLFSDEDKEKLEKFLDEAKEHFNNIFINQKFDNDFKFESLFSQKYKPSNTFKNNFKAQDWIEELIYTNEEDVSSTPTRIYKISKDENAFLYYMYSDLKDYECIVKYNDDIKDELEDMFDYGDLDTSNFIIFLILVVSATIGLLYYLYM